MVQFPTLGDADARQFLRDISAGGEFFEIGTGGLDFRQEGFRRLSAVATSDEDIEILDVAFRVFGEKDTVGIRTGCRPSVGECARKIPRPGAACFPRPANW